ncbi:unnamed protein product [Symbiodinium sp. CCMP2592]|nr:unnamed protein product [Symbiodinium sp. CCMP2592]
MYSRLEDQEPKGLGALCYVIFLGTFEWGMVIPTLWPLLQKMGSPEMYFGLVIGTFSLTRVICQPIIGALGDRWDFQVACESSPVVMETMTAGEAALVLFGTVQCAVVQLLALFSIGRRALPSAAYDKISANFAESRRFPWPFVVKWLGASRRDTLLVAGCGDGRHVQTALDLGFRRIFALDLSEGMLQAAQRRLGDSGESLVFLHGDTRSVPLPDESVQDVLSCISAAVHSVPLRFALLRHAHAWSAAAASRLFGVLRRGPFEKRPKCRESEREAERQARRGEDFTVVGTRFVFLRPTSVRGTASRLILTGLLGGVQMEVMSNDGEAAKLE